MDSIVPATALSVASLVSNLLGSAKTAKELAKQSSDPALKEQIAELFNAVLDVKERVLELDEENRSLRQQLIAQASIERRQPFGYYFAVDDPDPLCPSCYEATGKRLHLTASQSCSGGLRRECRVCARAYWEKPRESNAGRIAPRVTRY